MSTPLSHVIHVSVTRPGLTTFVIVVGVLARVVAGLGNLELVVLLWTHGHHGWALLDLVFGTGIALALIGPVFAFFVALLAMTPIGRMKVPADEAWHYQ
jgi:hypothetical protein